MRDHIELAERLARMSQDEIIALAVRHGWSLGTRYVALVAASYREGSPTRLAALAGVGRRTAIRAVGQIRGAILPGGVEHQGAKLAPETPDESAKLAPRTAPKGAKLAPESAKLAPLINPPLPPHPLPPISPVPDTTYQVPASNNFLSLDNLDNNNTSTSNILPEMRSISGKIEGGGVGGETSQRDHGAYWAPSGANLAPRHDSAESAAVQSSLPIAASGGDMRAADARPRKRARPHTDTWATWRAYAEAYARRYGAEPPRSARAMSIAKRLVATVGADIAPELARWYVTELNGWHATRLHPLELLLRDAPQLAVQMRRSVAICRAASSDLAVMFGQRKTIDITMGGQNGKQQ